MACFHPISAWRLDDGQISFNHRDDGRELSLPCGRCIGCRLRRSQEWAMRCLHESQMHSRNSFVTLTYNDECLPAGGTLVYPHFQLFMRRLRKVYGSKSVRFYMCGEYGDTTWRPHYHALLFGLDFPDRVYWKQGDGGFPVYRSDVLEKYWPHGDCYVGDVTYESAGYVARYIMKKISGDMAEDHYTRFDPYTGEISKVEPEFSRMSLKPGIGHDWFMKYASDVLVRDKVYVYDQAIKPPRYYDKIVERRPGVLSDEIAYERYCKGIEFRGDSTPDRLAVREKVTEARLSFKKRSNC